MFISICKNVIAGNNKRNWQDPKPAIRVSNTPSGKVTSRHHKVGITDKDGNIVATILSSTDGKPVISCGAKVAIDTSYPVKELEPTE